ncbi:Gustatory receptor 83 [Frankliniella occidentalis]|nr:Gustatory receptor 83 [Frankliniella occidentalis]
MNEKWVKKSVLCFWPVFYIQAFNFGIFPVHLESMRPLAAWRAGGSAVLCVSCGIANAALFSYTFSRSPDYILFMGINVISILLSSLLYWRTVHFRGNMCNTTRALLTHCERHPLSPSSWRLLLVASLLTTTFCIAHIAWVLDTFTDCQFNMWSRGFMQAASHALFFFLGWQHNLLFALVLIPVMLLALLFADLRQNCVELLQIVSKNRNEKDSGKQSNELSPECVSLLWRNLRCQYQSLFDIFSATRNLLQWHLVYLSFVSGLSSTVQLSDYIKFYNSTTPRSALQLAQLTCHSVRFVMLCLACQKFQSENDKMRQSILAYTSQIREFHRGNEVHMFGIQIEGQQNGICTVLWSFDMNAVTALQLMSAIVSYTIVMRQSDVHFKAF